MTVVEFAGNNDGKMHASHVLMVLRVLPGRKTRVWFQHLHQ